MLTYLLISAGLSVVGWLVYILLLRNFGSPWQRKRYLYVLVLASLALPLCVDFGLIPQFKPSPRVEALAPVEPMNHGELQQFCRCENPEMGHRFHYRTNATYNWLLLHKQWMGYGILGAMGLALLFFLVQIGYLYYLVWKGTQSEKVIGEKKVYLLTPHRPHAIGAFWLGRPFVIWSTELDQMAEEERLAILKHELSHLEQGNTLEKAALRLIQCLWFFNPVLYRLFHELELISELIADRAGQEAMPSLKAYAQLLLKVQQQGMTPLVSGLSGSILRQRVEALLNPAEDYGSRRYYGSLFLVMMLQVMLVTPLTAEVTAAIARLQDYEKVYHQAPEAEDVIFCTDCESICTPEH